MINVSSRCQGGLPHALRATTRHNADRLIADGITTLAELDPLCQRATHLCKSGEFDHARPPFACVAAIGLRSGHVPRNVVVAFSRIPISVVAQVAQTAIPIAWLGSSHSGTARTMAYAESRISGGQDPRSFGVLLREELQTWRNPQMDYPV